MTEGAQQSCVPLSRGSISRLLTWPLIAAVYLYRFTLSPLLGGQCRFQPTCSQYALDALRQRGPLTGTWLTIRRLARCHPLCKGGFDPVPPPPSGDSDQAQPPHQKKCANTNPAH